MISLYLPGNSIIHKIPAGYKLLGLALISIGLFFIPPSYVAAVAILLFGCLGYVVAKIPARMLWEDLRRLSFLLVFMAVTQIIFRTPEESATNTARVIAVILLAQVVTRTTKTENIMATAEKLFTPLKRFGVNPQKIGLAMALVLASVGHLSAMITQVRQAQKARGVRIAPWSWVVPVLVLSLKHADDVGDAMIVRGLE